MTTKTLTFGPKVPTIFRPSIFEDILESVGNSLYDVASTYPYNLYNVYEKEKGHHLARVVKVVLEYALAGFTKENIHIKITGDKVHIRVEKDKPDNENIEYLKQGIAERSMETSFSLSPNIDRNNIKSSFKDGMLKIEFPLKQEEVMDIDIN